MDARLRGHDEHKEHKEHKEFLFQITKSMSKKDIKQALREEVLQAAADETHKKEQQIELDTTLEALKETTSLDHSSITAIADNISTEASRDQNTARFPFIKLPGFRAEKARIAIYMVAGLLTYSAFSASQVRSIEREQSYNTMSSAKFDLQLGIGDIKMNLGSAYNQYHIKHKQYPQSLSELDPAYRATEYLDNSRHLAGYSVQPDSTIKLELADQYGYHRRVTLKPQLHLKSRSSHIQFRCESNAPDRLLHNHGSYWCESSSSTQ